MKDDLLEGRLISFGRGEALQIILNAIGLAGLLVVGVVAPNAVRLFSNAFSKEEFRLYRKKKKVLDQALQRMIDRGLIRFEHKLRGWRVVLTERGEREWVKYELGKLSIKRPKKWDGKWRLVMFDIPESRRKIRDNVRDSLQRLGLVRLQDSVWVYPFECEDVVELLKTRFVSRFDVICACADRLSNDRWLRKEFGL